MKAVSREDSLAGAFREAVCNAGLLALAYFRPGAATVARIYHKDGGSPVTEADYLVDRYLAQHLKPLLPQAGWLSEEGEDCLARLSRERVVVIDPIDGTRGFMSGHRGWSIAVALIEQGRPLLGVIHAPALGETYTAIRGAGAKLNGKPIAVSQSAAGGAVAKIAASKLIAEKLRQAGLGFELQPRIPSLALRIANVASGALDAAFASANARDWDIAAADIILREAGGRLAALDGSEILYNRQDTFHGPLVAAADPICAEANAAARQILARRGSS